ncbi:hypothetical protein [Rubrivirga litoralis]|uniref:Uncharacterized protein n=1 Tax=Rubrivirga litoralis TaxID=3075598 RepID=A0ABU3BUH1_9BACT|nr:hypothetical protein [Rubrivirga sp. F394]MDT0632933.1 hypothetical protein [Rubrivirga sp. F394]
MTADDPNGQALARDNAVAWLRGLPPRSEPLALGPGLTVTDHDVHRTSLVRRLLSDDPGTYRSALVGARRYRAAFDGVTE